MARPISITHRLEVLVAPRVQCKDSQVTLRKGESYTLRCSAQGQPNPRVSWSRRSGPASWPAQSGLSLHLARVDRTTEGEYVCTAANGVGQPAVASVSVSVLCKYIRLSVRTSPHLALITDSPEIRIDQQFSHNNLEHQITVKIDCTVHSNPPSQVTNWIFSWFWLNLSALKSVQSID